MLSGNEIRIAKIFGVTITLDLSWFLILILVTWIFAVNLGDIVGTSSIFINILLGLFGALLFFGSIVLHELSHTITARKNGLPISKITLFLFGGVSSLSKEPPTPAIELKMALAGPAASIIIGFVFILIAPLVQSASLALSMLFQSLGYINFFLAVFNLLPGFPLDGGRVLRALIWRKTGNLRRATYFAALSGQSIAVVLIILGALEFLLVGLFGGIWLAMIGFFLYRAAKISIKLVKER